MCIRDSSQVIIIELFLILILESEPKLITDLQTLQNIILRLGSHLCPCLFVILNVSLTATFLIFKGKFCGEWMILESCEIAILERFFLFIESLDRLLRDIITSSNGEHLRKYFITNFFNCLFTIYSN